MSSEIDIATYDKPVLGALEAVLPPHVQREYSSERFARFWTSTWELSADGPFSVEPVDLDERLLSGAISARWLTSLRLTEGAPGSAVRLARRLASEVARSSRGAALDCSTGKLIFPRGSGRPKVARLPESQGQQLICHWCFSPSRLSDAAEWLAVVERFFPEAAPVRFGPHEPFEHRYPDDSDLFVRMWASEARKGGLLDWTATRPCSSGGAAWPAPIAPRRRGTPAASLDLWCSASAFLTGPRWRRAMQTFFDRVARGLGAFYGRALVIEGGDTVEDHINHGRPGPISPYGWVGLPRQAAWLTWLGQPYASLLDPGPTGGTDEGILMEHPENLDPASRTLPAIPQRFFRRQPGNDEVGVERQNVEFEPASFLPELA